MIHATVVAVWSLVLHRRCNSQNTSRLTYLAWSIVGALSLAFGAFPGTLLLLIAVGLTPCPTTPATA